MVELLMVVALVGLLAAISIPAMAKSRRGAQVRRVANDLRVFANGFQMYSLQKGAYPKDCGLDGANNLPAGVDVEANIRVEQWTALTSFGGHYEWEGPDIKGFAGIAFADATADDGMFRDLDKLIDDGNLASGQFRSAGGRFTYVIEENAPVLN